MRKTSRTRPGEAMRDRVIWDSASSCFALTKIPRAAQSINEASVRSRSTDFVASVGEF